MMAVMMNSPNHGHWAVLGVGILDGARPSPLFDKWSLIVAGHGPAFSLIVKSDGARSSVVRRILITLSA